MDRSRSKTGATKRVAKTISNYSRRLPVSALKAFDQQAKYELLISTIKRSLEIIRLLFIVLVLSHSGYCTNCCFSFPFNICSKAKQEPA